jgi:hypothetical protein
MRYRLILSACLLAASAAAFAAVTGGSNFTAPYPDSTCGPRPARPAEPAGRMEGAITFYNQQVAAYNEAAQKYIACIGAYVDNANNDMERIREKARAAMEPARP